MAGAGARRYYVRAAQRVTASSARVFCEHARAGQVMSPTTSAHASPRPPWLHWRCVFPLVALLCAALIHGYASAVSAETLWMQITVPALAIGLLIPTVLVSLHHAEVAAARIGEPFGTLLLTLAVTTIEVAIIISVALHGADNPTLARESVFSVVMMICTGGVGLCLTLGALRYGEQDHIPQGTNAYLAVLMALAALTLILPNYTTTTGPGTFSSIQLGFVSFLSILLFLAFLYIQAVRHRGFFIDRTGHEDGDEIIHATAPALWITIACLIAGLVAVVLLAERVASGVEDGLAKLGVSRPDAIIGALIAALLLFPEILAALRATLKNQLQRSINILLGSALATIGLTIPAVAVVSLFTNRELVLGLQGRDEVLLILALTLSIVSFGTGRTNVLTGLVHLVVFFAYLMLLAVP
jgi:Ca2+:H+ antiporter